jgi:2-keto-4-pentenoate hydratase/2-oxohepta-3-ene-1,7-dioic acid hydratase in catechol pathway
VGSVLDRIRRTRWLRDSQWRDAQLFGLALQSPGNVRPQVKFVGIARDSGTWVARIDGDAVIPLAMVGEFWADPFRWQAETVSDAAPRLRLSDVTQVPYVPASARVLCIGLNYRAHAAEGSFEVPSYPTIFGRWTGSLSVGNVVAPVPANEDGLDWEGEVAVYIGARAEAVTEQEAADVVFGYSTFNDLTARRAQKLTAQWTLGKNGDFSGPMGPLVSRDEVGDLRDGLTVRTLVNGIEVQNGNTRDMIFSIESMISLISQTLTLHPGDVIVSGTPEGVGYVRTPPWLLHPGDTVEVTIDRLGTLVTPIGGPEYRGRA